MRAPTVVVLLALALLAPACGGGEGEGGDNAVEAMETNVFELDGLRYRIDAFRQINPALAPDRALYDGPPPEGRVGLYAAFLTACNESSEPRRPTDRVQLEDAFGEAYPQVGIPAGNPLAFEAEEILPGQCIPREDATADRSLPGAAVLFRVPFARLSNRPFVLELRALSGAETEVRRVQLDL